MVQDSQDEVGDLMEDIVLYNSGHEALANFEGAMMDQKDLVANTISRVGASS